MKNWKRIVALMAGLGLSACLQHKDQASFTLSYVNAAETDLLTISWDAKAQFDSLAGHKYFNGFKLDTFEGRRGFVESLAHGTKTHSIVNGQFMLHPQSFDFNTTCSLSNTEIVSCNIEFPKNSFPLANKNIAKFSIHFIYDSTEGLDNDRSDDTALNIETPYLDLTQATGIAYSDGNGDSEGGGDGNGDGVADEPDNDEIEPVVTGCQNLNKNSLSVYAAANDCLGKNNNGASFGVFGPMGSSNGGFCALNPRSSTHFAPFTAMLVGISCLLARRRYE